MENKTVFLVKRLDGKNNCYYAPYKGYDGRIACIDNLVLDLNDKKDIKMYNFLKGHIYGKKLKFIEYYKKEMLECLDKKIEALYSPVRKVNDNLYKVGNMLTNKNGMEEIDKSLREKVLREYPLTPDECYEG